MLSWFGKQLWKMHERNASGEAGFTLIELLVVVIIIGVLAAIAIPVFLAQKKKAQEASCASDTRNAATAAVSFAQDNTPVGSYAGLNLAGLTANGFRQSPGNTTTVTAADANHFELSTDCASAGDTATFDSNDGHVNTSW